MDFIGSCLSFRRPVWRTICVSNTCTHSDWEQLRILHNDRRRPLMPASQRIRIAGHWDKPAHPTIAASPMSTWGALTQELFNNCLSQGDVHPIGPKFGNTSAHDKMIKRMLSKEIQQWLTTYKSSGNHSSDTVSHCASYAIRQERMQVWRRWSA